MNAWQWAAVDVAVWCALAGVGAALWIVVVRRSRRTAKGVEAAARQAEAEQRWGRVGPLGARYHP